MHIGTANRQEFGLLRNWPDASLRLRARWIAKTRRRLGAANKRRLLQWLLHGGEQSNLGDNRPWSKNKNTLPSSRRSKHSKTSLRGCANCCYPSPRGQEFTLVFEIAEQFNRLSAMVRIKISHKAELSKKYDFLNKLPAPRDQIKQRHNPDHDWSTCWSQSGHLALLARDLQLFRNWV